VADLKINDLGDGCKGTPRSPAESSHPHLHTLYCFATKEAADRPHDPGQCCPTP